MKKFKPIGKKKARFISGKLAESLEAAHMKNANFCMLNPPSRGNKGTFGELPLPETEEEVDAFIKSRTRLYRETWIIPYIERAIEYLSTE